VQSSTFFKRREGVTRGHSIKLFKPGCQKDVLKFSFGHRSVEKWNKLPQHVVNSTTVNGFKRNIDNFLRNNGGF
jgi:hypothetical protein